MNERKWLKTCVSSGLISAVAGRCSQSWNEIEAQGLWTLLEDELALLPRMTDRGRLGFALQLKFRQFRSRFPEHHDEISLSPSNGWPLKSEFRFPPGRSTTRSSSGTATSSDHSKLPWLPAGGQDMQWLTQCSCRTTCCLSIRRPVTVGMPHLTGFKSSSESSPHAL